MNNTLTKVIFALFFFLFSNHSAAQIEVIWLLNPSFEEFPRPGITPFGWENCGLEKFPEESPPYIHPIPNQVFGVEQKPAHESTFLGMVVRESKSWESIGQTLSKPMVGDQCYIFRIKLCQSSEYASPIKGEPIDKKINFKEPIVLRIWGGEKGCEKSELLAISPKINHEDWLNYTFKFTPTKDLESITFEAYRAKGGPVFPNGNILLDHASPLVPIRCDMDKVLMASFDWSQYEVGLNNLKTEIDLQWYIASQGFYLNFPEARLSNIGKQNIQRIVAALEQFPNQKLLFYFDGSNRFKDRKRIESVKKQLDLEELPSDRYDVRKMKLKDYEKGWILKGNGFYISVEAKI